MSRTMLKPAPVKSKPVTTTTDNGLIITAAKREFFLPRKEIDETKIDLDPQNPRYSKPDGTEYTIGELAEKLQSDSKTVDLCRSIENNGLSDPIIVRRQKGGRYLDEEGNRRLTAWRMARHKASLKHGEESPEAMIYANIPAYILPTDMTERHWDVYLGMLHVQGKLIWDKAARAAHIRRLVEADGLSVKEVSDLLGIRESDVAENIKTLDALAEYQTSTEDREASSKFWHIYEFAKLPDTVKTDSGESSLNKEECVPAVNRAIRANAFHHSRDVRNLKTILANPKTRDDFKNHFRRRPTQMKTSLE